MFLHPKARKDLAETLYGPLEGEANTPIMQLLTKLGDDGGR